VEGLRNTVREPSSTLFYKNDEKAKNPRRVGRLGRVNANFSLGKTLQDSARWDCESPDAKFIRGSKAGNRKDRAQTEGEGENPGGEKSPGEHRASCRLKYAEAEQRTCSWHKALESSLGSSFGSFFG
jgi:hypothetical protein